MMACWHTRQQGFRERHSRNLSLGRRAVLTGQQCCRLRRWLAAQKYYWRAAEMPLVKYTQTSCHYVRVHAYRQPGYIADP